MSLSGCIPCCLPQIKVLVEFKLEPFHPSPNSRSRAPLHIGYPYICHIDRSGSELPCRSSMKSHLGSNTMQIRVPLRTTLPLPSLTFRRTIECLIYPQNLVRSRRREDLSAFERPICCHLFGVPGPFLEIQCPSHKTA
jgi:hypothetical protein